MGIGVGSAVLRAEVAQRTAHPPGCPCCAPAARLGTTRGRTRLWELPESLHCSVIGTCLTMRELRRIMGQLGFASVGASDHDVHVRAVALAGRAGVAAKLLGKALDQRFALEIGRFDRAHSEAEVCALWQEAVERAEIAGAYWALLTHPASSRVLIEPAFGEVHMMSHLLGATNRAELHRLRALEQEVAELKAALDRLRLQHQTTIGEREATIRDLRRELATRASTAAPREMDADLEELQRRVSIETDRRQLVEQRLERAQEALLAERQWREAAEAQPAAAADAAEAVPLSAPEAALPARLDGYTLLYVGGRASQIAHLRGAAERSGAALLHHDGGIEDSFDLLAGLVARADVVLFPVDCVSHAAALRVKRLCDRSGKRYVPLRSTGAASFLSGLARAA
jgi:hypothetical protein